MVRQTHASYLPLLESDVPCFGFEKHGDARPTAGNVDTTDQIRAIRCAALPVRRSKPAPRPKAGDTAARTFTVLSARWRGGRPSRRFATDTPLYSRGAGPVLFRTTSSAGSRFGVNFGADPLMMSNSIDVARRPISSSG